MNFYKRNDLNDKTNTHFKVLKKTLRTLYILKKTVLFQQNDTKIVFAYWVLNSFKYSNYFKTNFRSFVKADGGNSRLKPVNKQSDPAQKQM